MYWSGDSKNMIGKRLKEARVNSKPVVTQQDLASRLGVMGIQIDRVSISKIEGGNRFVSDYELLAISEALNVSLEWLLKGVR
jgi:transcriptional regulator with XRE-family HTH domain